MVKNLAHMIIEGLVYLHEKKVVFCDMSGGNLVFNEFNMLKFADFGNAKFLGDIKADDRQNIRKENWAPELFAGGEEDDNFGKGKTEKRMHPTGYGFKKKKSRVVAPGFLSDLWGLGCLLYQMASGKKPFSGKNLKQKILKEKQEPLEKMSNDFNSFVDGLLTKNPNKRMFWSEIISHPWLTKFDHSVIHGNLEAIKREKIQFGDPESNNSGMKTLKKTKLECKEKKQEPTNAESESESEGEAEGSDDSMNKTPRRSESQQERESDIDLIASEILNEERIDPGKSKLFRPEDLQKARGEYEQEVSFKSKQKLKGKIGNKMKDSIALDDKIFGQRVENILQHIRGLLLVTKKDKIIEQIIFNPRIEKIDLPKIPESLVESYPISLSSNSDNSASINDFLSQMGDLFKTKGLKQQKMLSILTYLTRLCTFKEVANLLTEHSLIDTLICSLKTEKSRRIKSAICTLLANALKNKVSLNPDFFNSTHFVILKDTFLNSNCPNVQARALASIGEYMFFCSTQDLSDPGSEEFDEQWQGLHLLEKFEKGIDIIGNLKSHKGRMDLGGTLLEDSLLNGHQKVTKAKKPLNNFKMPSAAVQLFLEQMSKNIRKPNVNQLYVLKSLQNIITLSKTSANKLSSQKKIFKILRDYIVFGHRKSSARGWATYCLLNLMYSVLQDRVEFSGMYNTALLRNKAGVYSVLNLLEENSDSTFTQTELLIKSLISDFKDRDEQVRLASMTLLLFVFANIPKEFFENIEEEDMAKLIKDLANLFEHASLRVKTKCLGIITIFVMRDFKALYYLLDYPKLLACFDRDLDKIEVKTSRGFEKMKFKGNLTTTVIILISRREQVRRFGPDQRQRR